MGFDRRSIIHWGPILPSAADDLLRHLLAGRANRQAQAGETSSWILEASNVTSPGLPLHRWLFPGGLHPERVPLLSTVTCCCAVLHFPRCARAGYQTNIHTYKLLSP
ncbi:hypothetical protein TWF970_011623 [Orbilia oligospora]|uniref:Uncharacterized protein n=1 Tax=Orbilia oligospora TaxID=2813651 RepID=A0A7C8VCH4_ORBOL|nr:hypothetical protein TWF970_011623 [Orbilia oligospora]